MRAVLDLEHGTAGAMTPCDLLPVVWVGWLTDPAGGLGKETVKRNEPA